jgi:hypothetical protein
VAGLAMTVNAEIVTNKVVDRYVKTKRAAPYIEHSGAALFGIKST